MKIKKTFPLILALATVSASASPAFADVVQNSCDILVDAARARTEEEVAALMPHLAEPKMIVDWVNLLGAASLPEQIDGFKQTIPPRDYELASAIRELREKVSNLNREIGVFESNPSRKQPQEQERYNLNIARRFDLQALLEAASSQLENDVSVAQSKYSFKAHVNGYDYVGVGMGYLRERVAFRECTGTFELPYQPGYFGICAVIDLTTGQTNYEFESTLDRGYGRPKVVAELHGMLPANAAKYAFASSELAHGLLKLQIEPMPSVCKELANSKFEAMAETESSPKSAPPTASVTAGAAPSPSQVSTN